MRQTALESCIKKRFITYSLREYLHKLHNCLLFSASTYINLSLYISCFYYIAGVKDIYLNRLLVIPKHEFYAYFNHQIFSQFVSNHYNFLEIQVNGCLTEKKCNVSSIAKLVQHQVCNPSVTNSRGEARFLCER